MKKEEDNWRQQTKAVHSGQVRSDNNETSEALFLTSGYVYRSAEEAESRFLGESEGFMYSRFGNPTVNMFETRLATIEGCEKAMATATGMAAVNASLMCQLVAGDHVISARALFGSCRYILEELLPRFDIAVTFVDGHDLDQWNSALRPNTRCGFVESPSNPMLDIIDISAVAEIIHKTDGNLIVDNAFSTPALQRPTEFGADIVVYSATKHIDGQGRCLGGAVLGSESFVGEKLKPFLRHTGPSLSPFNAWVLLKGLETLKIRVKQHSKNAMQLATTLSEHPKIKQVLLPSLPTHPQHDLAMQQMDDGGGIVTFEILGGKSAAFRFLNNLQLVKISNNLGDSKSLITHPSTTTHQRIEENERLNLGIRDGTVRLSTGLEDVYDIKNDLLRALEAV